MREMLGPGEQRKMWSSPVTLSFLTVHFSQILYKYRYNTFAKTFSFFFTFYASTVNIAEVVFVNF